LLAGAQGIKLTGKELEKALAGTPLFVASSPEDMEPLKVCKYMQCMTEAEFMHKTLLRLQN
jgi:hypothetical protein